MTVVTGLLKNSFPDPSVMRETLTIVLILQYPHVKFDNGAFARRRPCLQKRAFSKKTRAPPLLPYAKDLFLLFRTNTLEKFRAF